MAQTDYDTSATPAAERLVQDLFALGGVGYVALGSGQEVLLRRLPPAALGASAEGGFYDDLIAATSDSNFYEQLLVNPTLLKLAGQRGGLDAAPLAERAQAVLSRHGRAPRDLKRSLLAPAATRR